METARQDKRNPLKDRPLRLPGQSLDQEIHKLQLEIVFYLGLSVFLILIAYSEWVSWYFHTPPQPLVFFVIAVLFTAYGCYRIYQIQKSVQNKKLGRDGERIVGQALEELRQKGFAVFHDIIGKDFNVDHVIVSSNGIFAVETKTYSKPAQGKVTFDGKNITMSGRMPDSKPVLQAIANADWIRKDVLHASTGKFFTVIPVVVFPGWWVEETDNRQVWVLNPDRLLYKISHEPISLTQEDVHLAAFHLSRFVRMSE